MQSTEQPIVFRVDGSHSLGLGHLVRSLNLADTLRAELRKSGKQNPINFAVKPDSTTLAILRKSQFSETTRLVSSDEDEVESFAGIMGELSPRMVVVDIDLTDRGPEYLSLLDPQVVKVSLHEHNYGILPGDLVIAPTMRPLTVAPGGTERVTHFAGKDYILLSPDIQKRREKPAKPGEIVCIGFLSLGGADPERFTMRALGAIRAVGDRRINWHIVLGAASEYDAKGLSRGFPGPFVFHAGGDMSRESFVELLNAADVTIVNGGTTLYESLALGRPTVAVAQNDFEAAVIAQMAIIGACIEVEGTSSKAMTHALGTLLGSPDMRLQIAQKGNRLIDGQGCARVAKLIIDRL